MEITLKANQFRAARHCVPKRDVRYYLMGVLVRVYPDGRVMLAGADGACAFFGAADAEVSENPPETLSIIVPFDVTKTVGKRQGNVRLRRLDDNKWIMDEATVFAPIDGTYPDLARVTPERVNGKAATFNPDVLARAYNAVVEWDNMGTKYAPMLRYNGVGAAVMVSHCGKAVAVLMPMRIEGSDVEGPVPFDRSIFNQAAQ